MQYTYKTQSLMKQNRNAIFVQNLIFDNIQLWRYYTNKFCKWNITKFIDNSTSQKAFCTTCDACHEWGEHSFPLLQTNSWTLDRFDGYCQYKLVI